MPGARVHSISLSGDLVSAHADLAAHGPYDIVIDLAGGANVVRRFEQLFFHASGGGLFVSRLGPDDELSCRIDHLVAVREADLAPAPSRRRKGRPSREQDEEALARACGDVVRDGQYVAVTNLARTAAKAPELAMNRILAARPERGRVLATVPGATWRARCKVRVSQVDHAMSFPAVIEAPELSAREYTDVTCLPRQRALQAGLVLPESFRHNAARRLRHPELVDWAPWFVGLPETEAPMATDQTAYFFVDNVLRGHFGHALTEQISVLWGWRQAKERDPALKALVFAGPDRPVAPWEFALLEAAGIDRHDVHVAHEPLRVARLLTCSPAFSMPDFVHPQLLETYASMGEELGAGAPVREWPERVFLTRRGGARSCRNATEVETLFRAAGFEVVVPEVLPLAEQVAFVRRADVVAGFSGSNMFQIAFAGKPKHVILVGSESYTANNEYLLSSVVGHRLDVALCRPDLPAGDRFSAASYHSDFTFDPAREGEFLRRVLSEL